MPIRISNRLILINHWRILGFFSSIIGFTSYAFSSSFNHLYGKWNFIKIIIYTLVSFSISSMMLFLKKWKLSRRFLLKAHLGSMISCAAFALMSFCLSRQIDLGFETDLNFFLGILTVQLMKINLMLSIVSLYIEIDAADSNRNEFQQNLSLRRRVNHDDGYNWKKYEEKVAKEGENQRSYYKYGEIIETLYKGTHNHCKPTSSMKRNSSSEYLYSLLPSETGPIDLLDQSFGSEQLDSDEEPVKSSVSI
ncbi:WRKY family transcription factor [Medicago truncatula]|uniref:WRKY family transcription factor n=1 Tax=Medicago truncatula TaxID=3880 RepID=G7K8M1_MEDTR|nr:WRKY family transcription factor [Medicago truncatula]